MPEPVTEDLLDETVELDSSDASNLITRCARALQKAAYWQGVAEERLRMVEALTKDRDLTIVYLKDRLNRAELPKNAD